MDWLSKQFAKKSTNDKYACAQLYASASMPSSHKEVSTRQPPLNQPLVLQSPRPSLNTSTYRETTYVPTTSVNLFSSYRDPDSSDEIKSSETQRFMQQSRRELQRQRVFEEVKLVSKK